VKCPAGFFESSGNEDSYALDSLAVTDRTKFAGEADGIVSNMINANRNDQTTSVNDGSENAVSRVVSRKIASSDSPFESESAYLRQCVRCHATCAECTGFTAGDCSACHEGFLLSDGHCVQHCKDT
jgi:hypothetical protein